MSFINNIKIKLANNNIRKTLKRDPRKKEFHNLDSAKNIGIIFDLENESNYKTVKRFADDLGKQSYNVKAVAWVNADELPDFGVGQKTLFYTNKDVKWNGEPIATELTEFMNTKFDLLFILTDSDHMSVKYLTHISKAACKVGAFSESADHLDFMIHLTKNKSIDNLIKESLDFLKQIQKN
jgi:hypothetical protein